MTFFELLDYYIEIVPKSKLTKIGEGFSYYYSDECKNDIMIVNLIRIDIKKAFPTICNIIYKDNIPFIDKLNKLQSKIERNIFISTTLSSTELIILNNYCKLIIFCYVYNNYNNVSIFEYQKDGILFIGNENFVQNYELNILLSNFEFHVEKINKYIRINKTSIYIIDDNFYIKGKLKEPSVYLMSILNKILIKEEFDFPDLKKIYNIDYLKICLLLDFTDEINNKFSINKLYYLNKIGNKTKIIKDCYPISYLRYFIFPIVSLLKINNQ